MGASNPICYGDDGEYAVELFDRVDVSIDGKVFDGVVTAVHPRLGAVTVRYQDHQDIARTTGNPRTKRARLTIGDVELVARDG